MYCCETFYNVTCRSFKFFVFIQAKSLLNYTGYYNNKIDLIVIFFLYKGQNHSTLTDRKHEKKLRVVVTILIA